MIERDALLAYCNELLEISGFKDYCPNGLQVEGCAEIRHLATGVTASQALIEAAAEQGADALLVHHGYFWRGEDPCVVGMKRKRLSRLLEHDISLLAYHLPLDAHAELGNNARLGALLGFACNGRFASGDGPEIGWYTEFETPHTAHDIKDRLAQRLERDVLHIDAGGANIRRLGWCTGAAQSYLEAAAAMGLDGFISGEISEQTTHIARELGIHYFAAGHHATERYGVQALGAHLAERFGLRHTFIDIPNPV